MGRGVQWYSDAWDEYCEWQRLDRAAVKRIHALIKDARRDPFSGIGKPEALRHELSARPLFPLDRDKRDRVKL